MQPNKRAPAIQMRLRATWRLPPQTARARLEGPARRLGALNRRVSTRVRASMRACVRACACLRICGCESGISVYATRSRRRTIELRLLLTRVSLLLRDQGSRLWRLLVQRICTLRGACFCRGYVTSLLRDRFGALWGAESQEYRGRTFSRSLHSPLVAPLVQHVPLGMLRGNASGLVRLALFRFPLACREEMARAGAPCAGQ